MGRGPGDDYVEVNERILEFRDKYPDGVLQAEIVPCPFEGFLAVKAYAYRTPDDPLPGTGMAWEPVPGKTNFTRDSELMNAETSAWGRALIAVGAADAKRGIASANEVRNRSSSDAPSGAESSPAGRNCVRCGEAIVGSVERADGGWAHKGGCEGSSGGAAGDGPAPSGATQEALS